MSVKKIMIDKPYCPCYTHSSMEDTTTISVKDIPVDLWKQVRIAALAREQSVPEFVAAALEQSLHAHSPKERNQ